MDATGRSSGILGQVFEGLTWTSKIAHLKSVLLSHVYNLSSSPTPLNLRTPGGVVSLEITEYLIIPGF